MEQNITLDPGTSTFQFMDNDGEVFAYLKLNPTDPRLVKRCEDMLNFFLTRFESNGSVEEVEETVEQKFCDFLGYDCKQSLFGRFAATSIMADGRIFAAHILDALMKHIGPEIKRRRAANMARYTAKYKK